MKTNISKLLLAGTAALSLMFMSCNDAEYDVLENQAYIAQTNTNGNTSKKITVGNDDVQTELSVRLSSPTTANRTFEVAADESVLAAYNAANTTNYELLPASQYTMSSTEATVEAGTSASQPIEINIKPLSQELKESGKKFAIALKLKSKDAGQGVLQSGSTIVYVLDQVVYQAVPTINSRNNVHMTMRQDYELTEWTVEFNINIDKLGTAVGGLNNQTIFGAWGPDGKDGEIYIRFGDAPIEGNRLQIKTQGTQMNSNMLFNANTWYHIAYVCTGAKLYLYVNGQLDNSMDMPGKETRVSAVSISSNSSYNRGNSFYSEVRLWKKARSQKEIQNNMYSCDPATPGFIFYYKFNEGQGYQFKDWSGNGNDATTKDNTTPVWIQDVRIDGK